MRRISPLAAVCACAIALAASAQTYQIEGLKPPSPRIVPAPKAGAPCDGCARILSIREVTTGGGVPQPALAPVPGGTPGGLNNQNLIGAVIYLPLGDRKQDRPYIGPVGTPEMSARMSETTYEIALKMEDGSLRLVRRSDGSSFAVGDRVQWLGGDELVLLAGS